MADTVVQMFEERRARLAEGAAAPDAKAETVKVEAKPDPAKVETAKAETAKAEPAKTEATADPAKVEPGAADADPDLDGPQTRLTRRLRKQLADGKALLAANTAHEAEIVRLKGLLETAAKGKSDWLDEFRPKADPKSEPAPDDLAVLQRRMDGFQDAQAIREATVALEAELAEVAKDHPDTPRDLLLRAVELDDKADLSQIAEEYDAFALRLRGEGVTKQEPAKARAAVRPPDGRSAGGAQASSSTTDIYAGATTVAELFRRRSASQATA